MTTSCLLLSQLPRPTNGLSWSRTKVQLFQNTSAVTCVTGHSISHAQQALQLHTLVTNSGSLTPVHTICGNLTSNT